MSNRILYFRQQADENFKKLLETLNKIDERLYEGKCRLYEDRVRHLDDELLGYEFADRIGDELKDFDRLMYHYGRKFIEDLLIDDYSSEQYGRLGK